MTSILDLSAELLQQVFIDVAPLDIASLAATCKSFHAFTQQNRLLWKGVYLRHYDEPLIDEKHTEPDWETDLRRFSRLAKILESDNVDLKHDEMLFASRAIVDLVTSARKYPRDSDSSNLRITEAILTPHSSNLDAFLARSSIFTDAGTDFQIPSDIEEERQLSAKLHVLYGVPLEPKRGTAECLHTRARSRVYDLRNYTRNTQWGPFKDTPGPAVIVDWEKVESIMIVLAYNLRQFSYRTCGHIELNWGDYFSGCSPYSFESRPICSHEPANVASNSFFALPPLQSSTTPLYFEPPLPPDCADPYGITGTWRRVVCFLDYTDLYTFNFEGPQPLANEPRRPIDTQEAIRLITMKLRVTRISPPGPTDGQDYPVVHFNGASRSLQQHWDPNASSRIRGTVRQTPEGEIRWTSFSLFHGEERWRSESVQIGGIGSARGTLGTWFDKDFDAAGPAGPTAFWKISDEVHEDKVGGVVQLQQQQQQDDDEEEEDDEDYEGDEE